MTNSCPEVLVANSGASLNRGQAASLLDAKIFIPGADRETGGGLENPRALELGADDAYVIGVAVNIPVQIEMGPQRGQDEFFDIGRIFALRPQLFQDRQACLRLGRPAPGLQSQGTGDVQIEVVGIRFQQGRNQGQRSFGPPRPCHHSGFLCPILLSVAETSSVVRQGGKGGRMVAAPKFDAGILQPGQGIFRVFFQISPIEAHRAVQLSLPGEGAGQAKRHLRIFGF